MTIDMLHNTTLLASANLLEFNVDPSVSIYLGTCAGQSRAEFCLIVVLRVLVYCSEEPKFPGRWVGGVQGCLLVVPPPLQKICSQSPLNRTPAIRCKIARNKCVLYYTLTCSPCLLALKFVLVSPQCLLPPFFSRALFVSKKTKKRKKMLSAFRNSHTSVDFWRQTLKSVCKMLHLIRTDCYFLSCFLSPASKHAYILLRTCTRVRRL